MFVYFIKKKKKEFNNNFGKSTVTENWGSTYVLLVADVIKEP